MSVLWLMPLGVGALGALAIGIATRKLARNLEALEQAVRPLRAARGAGPTRGRRAS